MKRGPKPCHEAASRNGVLTATRLLNQQQYNVFNEDVYPETSPSRL